MSIFQPTQEIDAMPYVFKRHRINYVLIAIAYFTFLVFINNTQTEFTSDFKLIRIDTSLLLLTNIILISIPLMATATMVVIKKSTPCRILLAQDGIGVSWKNSSDYIEFNQMAFCYKQNGVYSVLAVYKSNTPEGTRNYYKESFHIISTPLSISKNQREVDRLIDLLIEKKIFRKNPRFKSVIDWVIQ